MRGVLWCEFNVSNARGTSAGHMAILIALDVGLSLMGVLNDEVR